MLINSYLLHHGYCEFGEVQENVEGVLVVVLSRKSRKVRLNSLVDSFQVIQSPTYANNDSHLKIPNPDPREVSTGLF